MAHAFTSNHWHAIFSTYCRRPMLYPELLGKTCRYITGIAKNIGCRMLRVNGTENHLHILMGLPADMSIAEAMRKIKSNSSKWIHETLPNMRQFAWQEGYAGLVVEPWNVSRLIDYIIGQEAHHHTQTFEEEHGPTAYAVGYPCWALRARRNSKP